MNSKMLTIVLTLATAIIHLYMGISYMQFGGPQPPLFILNGIGYLALLAGLYFIPQLAAQRGLIRYALMGFAAVTIVAYFIVNGEPFNSVLGLVTKAIELALIVVLWMGKE